MPEDNTFNQTDDAVETTTNSEIPISDDYGVFLVGETGQVTLNYLYDGGAYKGEVAFFSLKDMEELEPGSPEFIQEAARRSLSNSEDGHVVIKDPSEGAQFTEELIGDYHNTDAESYAGPKEFSMRPGDEFAVMLVPNSTVESLLDNPELDGENRPLFSLATANPDDGLQIGQIADLSGEGSAFAMEDLRVDNGSDKDYNDVIFQIRGAIGTAIHVDEMIATQNDWRDTEEGEQLQGEIEEFLAPSVVESDESEAEEESAEETLEDTAEETEEDTAEEPIADSEDIEGTEAEDDLAGSEDSDTIPETVGPFDSGFFVVGNSGEVNFNFLYDGGGFSNGEVALFDIEGMEELEPGSEEFIKEAARRSLTDSQLGHVVIRDAEEGAQISEGIGDAFNEGEYQGVKSVSMTPGSTFAVMLVPNGKVQDLFDNPGASGAKRPLFSLSTANPNEFFHVGQVADLTGHGSAFVMEDLRVDSSEGSDKDYNDIIFQVTGATGSAISLDELVEEQSLDAVRAWRESEEGQEFLVEVEQVIAESIEAQEDIEGSEGDDDMEDSDDDMEDSDDDMEDSDDDM
ncbi:DUF4114 domain-containing protein, partial [Phormidium sp. CCY1219]|uniref:DUF4114 domain-containing protein n=1 Tax=Phormidium sp. CCY1219 TaxID=2886104 RepID=UPI002D1F2D2A